MIFSLKKEHTAAIAAIHQESLATDFLSSLGFGFLKTVYDNVVEKPGIYGFVSIDKNNVQGFVMGAKNTNLFFKRAMSANLPKLFFYIFWAIIKNPRLIKNVFETILYPTKSDGSSAELVVIAVDTSFRKKGVGKALIQRLEKRFIDEGIRKYKLTVHADKMAIYFYEKLAYDRKSAFSLYNKRWYVYEKKI